MWKQAQYLQMKENSVLSLQKYPFTRRSDEEKKRIKELLAPAATDGITETRLALFLSTIVLKSIKVCPSPGIYMYINHTRNLDSGELCVQRLSAGTSRV